MFHKGTKPPIGMKESCMALTAPQEASVVTVAKSEELKMPKRTSLPSRLPQVWSTPKAVRRGLPCASAYQQTGGQEYYQPQKGQFQPITYQQWTQLPGQTALFSSS